MSVQKIEGDTIEVYIKDLFGVNMRRGKSKVPNKVGGCLGLELHTFSEKDANKLKHHVMFLSHPSEAFCNEWLDKISNIIESMFLVCLEV